MKATHIILGGVVSRSETTGLPPMGSGAFASDSDKAAVIRDIQLIDQDGTSTPIGDDMPAQITDFRIYSVSPMVGSKFSYGGPRKVTNNQGSDRAGTDHHTHEDTIKHVN
jgi:hypothetical protein